MYTHLELIVHGGVDNTVEGGHNRNAKDIAIAKDYKQSDCSYTVNIRAWHTSRKLRIHTSSTTISAYLELVVHNSIHDAVKCGHNCNAENVAFAKDETETLQQASRRLLIGTQRVTAFAANLFCVLFLIIKRVRKQTTRKRQL
jgi:flagellar biosynthesis/type III secretory pathway M-ring protein FliF/YscJ